MAEPEFLQFRAQCDPHTMTSAERLYGLYRAVKYIDRRPVSGDVVECGVWRGGSSMMAALDAEERQGHRSTTLAIRHVRRDDAAASQNDRDLRGELAEHALDVTPRAVGARNVWCYAAMEDVRANLLTTGLAADRFELVQGRVEETIPARLPDRISILRLDTDWFESTWHELRHLYERLQPGGVLIVDDYGHWLGAREAVDRFFTEHAPSILLTHLDYTGVIGVKT